MARDSKGRFLPGTEKVPGSGRKASSPNAIQKDYKKKILDTMRNHLDNLDATLSAIEDPKDRIDAIAKILPFVMPRIQSISVEDVTKRDLSIEERLIQLNSTMNQRLIVQQKKLACKSVSFEKKALPDESQTP